MYCGGSYKSPDDPNDSIYESLAHAPKGYYITEMPNEHNMLELFNTIRNQGCRGTCAAFVGATIREYHEKKNDPRSPVLSPEFIYYHRENKPLAGMHGRNVFQILQKMGTVPEVLYPYGATHAPSRDLYDVAQDYKIASFVKITTVDGLKRALLELGPCFLLLPLYKSNPCFWRPEADEKCISGHAVTVIGYTAEGFILRNSWGDTWGDSGCIVFPYNEWDLQWECWAPVFENTKPKKVEDCALT